MPEVYNHHCLRSSRGDHARCGLAAGPADASAPRPDIRQSDHPALRRAAPALGARPVLLRGRSLWLRAAAGPVRARHRLSKFPLRHGRRFTATKKAWTKRHAEWLQTQRWRSRPSSRPIVPTCSLGADYFDRRSKAQLTRRLIKRLEGLGVTVEVRSAA